MGSWRNPPEWSVATEELLTLKQIAGYVKLAGRTLYRLAQDRELPDFTVGNSRRLRLRDIDTWIEDQKVEARRAGRSR